MKRERSGIRKTASTAWIMVAAALLPWPALLAAEAEEARYFVDIAPCMALADAEERAGCYESLAAVVTRARRFESIEAPAPPAPPEPLAPAAPLGFEDRGARVLRIEEGSPEPGWRLGDEVGVWVDRRGGANVLLILERRTDGP